MKGLATTELLKLTTTRTTVALAAVGLAVAALLGLANGAIAGNDGAPALGSPDWVENVVGVSTVPAAVALLLGVLLAAGEYQHHTITTTFLATPRRSRVVAAKALAAAVAGVVLAVAMAVVAAAATVPAVVSDGASVDAFHRGAVLAVAGVVLASALLGPLGVLLGLLLRSQVAAVVLVVAWFTVVEAIADMLTGGSLHRWLPAGAAADLAGNGGQPMWAAAAVVVAWTALAAVVTLPAVTRRDVT